MVIYTKLYRHNLCTQTICIDPFYIHEIYKIYLHMKAYVTKFILNVMYAQIYIAKHGKQKNQKQNFILKFLVECY